MAVPRAVLDTSALTGPGNRRALQSAASYGYYEAYWSPWIIAELHRVLTWQWYDDHGDSAASRRECSAKAKAMMGWLLPVVRCVDPAPPYPPPWASLPDADDISV